MNRLDRYDLDATDWNILQELQEDARLSYAEIGRRVGMSSPAVQERIRKMEDYGIIRGYRVDIDLPKAGYPIHCYVRVAAIDGVQAQQLNQIVQSMPEVLECHHITGEDCYLIRIAATSLPHLDELVNCFRSFTRTVTSIVMSSPIDKRIIRGMTDDAD